MLSQEDTIADALGKLIQLRKSDAISDDEFRKLKTRLVQETRGIPTGKLLQQLERLAAFKADGFLSDAEFENCKRLLSEAPVQVAVSAGAIAGFLKMEPNTLVLVAIAATAALAFIVAANSYWYWGSSKTTADVEAGADIPHTEKLPELTCGSDVTKSTFLSLANKHSSDALIETASGDESNKVGAQFAEKRQNILDARQQCTANVQNKYATQGSNDLAPATYDPAYAEYEKRMAPYLRELKECDSEWNQQLGAINQGERAALEALKNRAASTVRYWIDTIRVTAVNNDTGALLCAAVLNADIPGIGGAQQDVTYKVEQTTDHRIFISSPFYDR